MIFPGGYYLQTGEFKRFDTGLSDMRYQRTVAASNGEDYLYLFYAPDSGTYVQLRIQPDQPNGRNTPSDLPRTNVL